MTITYDRPAMHYWTFCEELLNVPHLLVAGSSGSGKSVLINSLIYTALGTRTPANCKFVFIDPKRVELREYADLFGWTLGYCTEADDALIALDYVIRVMFQRYAEMQSQGLRTYAGGDIYVVIDEYADLAITAKRALQERVIRISQLGRAAKIHLIIATQRPTADTINAAIKTNMDYRIALHTAEAQHSRNIIGQRGAELLQIGQGYFYTPRGLRLEAIPYTSDAALTERVNWWRQHPGVIQPEPAPAPERKQKKGLLRLLRGA